MNLVVMVMLLKPLLPDVGTFPAKTLLYYRECDIALIVVR
jgi:hypothetical protein